GRATTQKVVVDRVREVDVGDFATAFARAEMSSGPMGQLSPRDTVRATVGPAHLLLDYGRPRKRGREIFGNVVPWNHVWRTGAPAGVVSDRLPDAVRRWSTSARTSVPPPAAVRRPCAGPDSLDPLGMPRRAPRDVDFAERRTSQQQRIRPGPLASRLQIQAGRR